MKTIVRIMLLSLFVPAALASAQTPTQQQVSEAVKPGERVRITIADGSIRRGRVALVNADSLGLLLPVRGATTLSLNQIRRIEVDIPDPVSDGAKRGAWIGLGVGGGIGLLMAISLCEGLSDCGGGFVMVGLLGGLGTGLGAVFGKFGDSRITDTRVVWPRPGTSMAARPVGVGMLAGPRRVGVGLTIRW